MPFKRHLIVASLDPLVNPVDETLLEDDVEAVDSVLPRPFQDLLDRREIVSDFLEALSKLEHFVNLQRLVESHCEVLNDLAPNDLSNQYY